MTQTLGKLEKVEIRKVWIKEDIHFTPWLASPENIALLCEELNIEIEILAQEKYVGPFRADILGKDTATDHFVIIENQFGKTDHNHLGQIITYASGLNASIIIWISERFTEEHRSALDWLNKITDDSVEFFGIEIELYRIGDSAPAPMFNIVSKPNNWSKTIKRKSSEAELTDTKLLQQTYWQSFKDYVETQKVSFRLQKPLPQHWTNISIGRSDFKICAIANTRDKWLCVQLVIYGLKSLEVFNTLRMQYEVDSKNKLSPNLEWNEKEGKEQHVNIVFLGTDPALKDDWKNQHKKLSEWIEKFYLYFKDKVREIV
jgi:hypothetical protein